MPPTRASNILGRLTALSDPTRCRILRLLEQHELTVGDLCASLQLPQSTVSRHLRVLADEGWVAALGEGTSRFYKSSIGELDSAAPAVLTDRRLIAAARAFTARCDPTLISEDPEVAVKARAASISRLSV